MSYFQPEAIAPTRSVLTVFFTWIACASVVPMTSQAAPVCPEVTRYRSTNAESASDDYTIQTWMVIDPLRSAVTPGIGWARSSLDDEGAITIASTMLVHWPIIVDLAAFETESIQERVPLPGSMLSAELLTAHGEWGLGGNTELMVDLSGHSLFSVRFWADVGTDTYEMVELLCDPDGPQRLVCWWNGLGLPGPALEPEYVRPDHFPRLVWDRYETLDDIPQTSPAQAIEQYVLFGEGA
jgi:hypothetical protein